MPKPRHLLQQRVHIKTAPDCARLARCALPTIRAIDGLDVEVGGQDLLLLGEDELTLAEGVARLRRVFPDTLEVGEPTVVYQRDPLREPIMRVTVTTSPSREDEIRACLRARAAQFVASARGRDELRIHALAPLSRLLGCQQQWRRTARSGETLRLEFSHFQTVDAGRAPPLGPWRERSA